MTANAAYMGLLYGSAIAVKIPARSQRYVCWAQGQMRYLLGDVVTSFLVGFTPKGGSGYTHAHDRGASCPNPPAVCNAITGLYNPKVHLWRTDSQLHVPVLQSTGEGISVCSSVSTHVLAAAPSLLH